MKHILSLFILSVALSVSAQKTVTIKPGTSLSDYFSKEETYLYPRFEIGTVVFKNGTISSAPMNYHILLGEMIFIQSPNDTLQIANPETMKLILLNNDTFFYFKGYHCIIATGPNGMLSRKLYLKQGDTRKGDAYGTTSSLSSTMTMNSYVGKNHDMTRLVANQEYMVTKCSEFYIRDSKGKFKLLNKGTINKLYPTHKDDIEKFMENEKIDLNKETDAIKLFNYLKKY